MSNKTSVTLCQRAMSVQLVPVVIAPVTIGNSSAWQSKTLEPGANHRYFYYDIQDSLLKNGNGQSVTIELTYRDQFNAPISLQYDSSDKSAKVGKWIEGVTTGESCQWKTISWTLTDTAFRSRCHGHDFRIAIGADVDFIIAQCAVSGTPKQTTILPDIFSSNMVLQRDVPVLVWGKASDGTCVTVSFGGIKRDCTASSGKWRVVLPSMNASCEPQGMSISSDDGFERKMTNILVGDVYLASGQSNMEMQLRDVTGGLEEVSDSANPMLRLFTVSRVLENTIPPLGTSWLVSSPDSASSMSAIAYLFGKEIYQTQRIPIGIINCSYGGTVTETWCSPETLAQGWPEWESFEKKWRQSPDWVSCNTSSYLYKRMLKSVLPFPLKGFIWYQGEGNADRAEEQKKLLPSMIRDWRKSWGNEKLPFYIVQLARFVEADWHAFRCAQLDIWKNTPNTYMAVTIDLSRDWNMADHPIHPKAKAPIGHRLALAARASLYGEKDLVYSGPVIREMYVADGKAVLLFDFIGTGLAALDDQPLRGFYLSANGQVYIPAEADIVDDTVIVFSPKVPNPIAVRYGAEDDMGKEKLEINLANIERLPSSPFTLFVK